MQNFKFFGGLIFVIIFIVSLVYFLNRQAFHTVFENQEALAEGSEWVEKTYSLAGLVDYIEANPEYVSVASLNLSYPDQSIHFHDDTPRVMGSVGHLALTGSWFEARQEGLFPGDSLIAIEDIERFNLPNVSESAHKTAIQILREQGQDGYVQLNDVVRIVIKHNHMASADYLFDLLGFDRIDSFTQTQFNEKIDTPLPWSGFYILAQPMLHGQPADEKFNDLEGLRDDSLRTLVLDRFEKYRDDDQYHSKVRQAFGGDGHNLNFTQQRRLHNLMPKGRADALARFAEKILNEEFISEDVSREMYHIMSWPLEEGSTRQHLERYGAVYENRMSILGGVDMGASEYTGERYAQAILYDNMPIGLWMHMSSNFMNQDYQKRLIYDPELKRRSVSALSN